MPEHSHGEWQILTIRVASFVADASFKGVCHVQPYSWPQKKRYKYPPLGVPDKNISRKPFVVFTASYHKSFFHGRVLQ